MASNLLPIYRRPKDDPSKYDRHLSEQSTALDIYLQFIVDGILDDQQKVEARSTLPRSDSTNPYIDQPLMENLYDYGPDNNADFVAQHTANGILDSNPPTMRKETTAEQLSVIVSPPQISSIDTMFRLSKQLGNGASCQVFKASLIETGEVYAVKRMSKAVESNLASFDMERNLLQKLVHPSIVSYHDSGHYDEYYFISTSYASGMFNNILC